MIDAVMTDEIEAIVQDVAREWAAQWTAEHLFISRGELSRTGAVAVVTVALGGPAREHVSRLEIDVAGRGVTKVRPVVPSWPRGRDVVTPAMLAWAERCWPEVERVALERGARAPVCTGMAVQRRWWLVGKWTLVLCVEDLSRPVWARRYAALRFTEEGRLLSDPSEAWALMKGRKRAEEASA
jgi:hypothetical protein